MLETPSIFDIPDIGELVKAAKKAGVTLPATTNREQINESFEMLQSGAQRAVLGHLLRATLREVCQHLGLDASGTAKAPLVERIMANLHAQHCSVDDGAAASGATSGGSGSPLPASPTPSLADTDKTKADNAVHDKATAEFVKKWSKSAASERANKDAFL